MENETITAPQGAYIVTALGQQSARNAARNIALGVMLNVLAAAAFIRYDQGTIAAEVLLWGPLIVAVGTWFRWSAKFAATEGRFRKLALWERHALNLALQKVLAAKWYDEPRPAKETP